MSGISIQYPQKGVPIYATASALPTPPPRSGSLAEVADTNILYVSDGSVWNALASPGASPTAIDGLTGDVSASGPGVVPATVNSIGGSPAAYFTGITSNVQTQLNAKANTVLPAVNHTIYVDASGNDTTGNGSYEAPYATVSKALSVTPSNLTNTGAWAIKVGPSQITDPNPILLKGNVFIVGDSMRNLSRLSAPSIGLDSSLYNGTSAANAAYGFQCIRINAGFSADFTGATINGTLSQLVMDLCQMTGTITVVDPLSVFTLNAQYSYLFGSISLTGLRSVDMSFDRCNAITITDGAITSQSVTMNLIDCGYSSLTVTNATASNTFLLNLLGVSPSTSTPSQVFSAANVASTISYDNSSLLIGTQSGTYSNSGFTLNPIQEARSLAYNPSVPGNWSPTPTEVHTALDQLAASLGPTPGPFANVHLSNLSSPTAINQDLLFGADGVKSIGLTASARPAYVRATSGLQVGELQNTSTGGLFAASSATAGFTYGGYYVAGSLSSIGAFLQGGGLAGYQSFEMGFTDNTLPEVPAYYFGGSEGVKQLGLFYTDSNDGDVEHQMMYWDFSSAPTSITMLPASDGLMSIGSPSLRLSQLYSKSGVHSYGSLSTGYTSQSGSYSAAATDSIIGINNTSAPRTVTLAAASSQVAGSIIIIKDESGAAATNNITITAADNIDGMGSASITQNYGVIRLYCTGSTYFSM